MAEDAGEKADDGIDDDGCSEFAAGEDIVADGEFFIAEKLRDALIDSFVAAADENDAVEGGETAGGGLSEALALRGEQDDGLAGGVATGLGRDLERFDAIEDGFGLEHHAFAAAEGTIVDGAMTVMREAAEIVGVDFGGAFAQATRDNAEIQHTRGCRVRAAKEGGEDGDDVEAHRADSRQ